MTPLPDFLLFTFLFTVLYLCLGYSHKRQSQPLPARRRHTTRSHYGRQLRVDGAIYRPHKLYQSEVKDRAN